MYSLMAVLIFANLVGIYCDCGCLTCSKNLRIVSPPSAPCKIIHRGYSCKCPKPIPYTVEVPKPVCHNCPIRTFDYKVETVDFVKPSDPKYSYTYDVQVPVKQECKCKYLYGLVATPDRIVLPAVDDCIPEKPTCSGPIIEYIPRCEEEIICNRGKREVTFNSLSSHKSRWPEWAKNENKTLFPSSNKPSKRTLFVRQRPLDKPFRVSIPLSAKRRFFPFRKSVHKPKDQVEAINKLRPETNFAPNQNARDTERKRHVEILQNWGKFADVPNVEIQDTFTFPTWDQKTRKTRSLSLDEDSYPFYKIFETSRKAGDDGFEISGESTLESRRNVFMRPFDIENLLPHTPFFYLINTPIRALNHFHKLRQHVSPVVKSVPVVIDSSSGYFRNLGKKLQKAGSDLLDSFTKTLPGFDLLLPLKRERRLANVAREKRTLFKVVDEDDVHEFLREKLSVFSDDTAVPDEDFLTPVTLETVREPKNTYRKSENTNQKKLVVEKLLPKLTFSKGQTFVDVNGIKKPLPIVKQRKPNDFLRSKNIPSETDDVKGAIEDLIEEAKLMATHRVPSGKFEEIEMPLQIIKERISQSLDHIEKLIDADFDDNARIYEKLLRLQILKGALVDHWKAILINKKHNDMGEKIRVLNSIHEIQSIKDRIVENIVVTLLGDDNFASQNLIKMLIRLQKLQCVLVRIVEDFGEKIRLRTPFDVQKEIKYVDYLEEINFVAGKNNLEVGDELRKERDANIEKHLNLLDNLKSILSKVGDDGFSSKIDEVARQLWEVRNLEKMQRETIFELDDKLQTGQKIRRELKILFDLQKQLEICEEKLNDFFKDTLVKNEGKIENVVPEKSRFGGLKLAVKKSLPKKAPTKWSLKAKHAAVRKKDKNKGAKGLSLHKS